MSDQGGFETVPFADEDEDLKNNNNRKIVHQEVDLFDDDDDENIGEEHNEEEQEDDEEEVVKEENDDDESDDDDWVAEELIVDTTNQTTASTTDSGEKEDGFEILSKSNVVELNVDEFDRYYLPFSCNIDLCRRTVIDALQQAQCRSLKEIDIRKIFVPIYSSNLSWECSCDIAHRGTMTEKYFEREVLSLATTDLVCEAMNFLLENKAFYAGTMRRLVEMNDAGWKRSSVQSDGDARSLRVSLLPPLPSNVRIDSIIRRSSLLSESSRFDSSSSSSSISTSTSTASTTQMTSLLALDLPRAVVTPDDETINAIGEAHFTTTNLNATSPKSWSSWLWSNVVPSSSQSTTTLSASSSTTTTAATSNSPPSSPRDDATSTSTTSRSQFALETSRQRAIGWIRRRAGVSLSGYATLSSSETKLCYLPLYKCNVEFINSTGQVFEDVILVSGRNGVIFNAPTPMSMTKRLTSYASSFMMKTKEK